MRKRAGFTIVELLVVISILGVLLGIVATAANGALKNGREKRGKSMRSVLQQAIAAYYSQKGEWPSVIEQKTKNMGEKTVYTFTPKEADQIFQEMIKASTGAGAVMNIVDASALFVADSTLLKNNGEGCYDNHNDSSAKNYCGNQRCINGVDFTIASDSKKRGAKIPLSSMAFGYQGREHGKFRRFWITYNGRTDEVTVSLDNPDKPSEEEE